MYQKLQLKVKELRKNITKLVKTVEKGLSNLLIEIKHNEKLNLSVFKHPLYRQVTVTLTLLGRDFSLDLGSGENSFVDGIYVDKTTGELLELTISSEFSYNFFVINSNNVDREDGLTLRFFSKSRYELIIPYE